MRTSTLFTLLLCVIAYSLPAAESKDRQKVATLLHNKFPKAKIGSIEKTRILGLWETLVDGQIIYVDSKVQFFFTGSIYSVASMHNLTDDSLQKARASTFSSLPKELAIIRSQGTGKRVFAIFEDPLCRYCKNLEKELDSLSDFTAYIFMYPILGENSRERVVATWCNPNRLQFWLTTLSTGNMPPSNNYTCETPVDQLLGLGARLGITGTPTILLKDGSQVEGSIAANEFSGMLDRAELKH